MNTQAVTQVGRYHEQSKQGRSASQPFDPDAPPVADRGRSPLTPRTGSLRSLVQSQVHEALAGIPAGEDGKLTFDEVRNHKEALLSSFEESVKKDLRELGVDENIEFSIGYDMITERFTVSSDHPDKAKVESYLAGNEERASQFRRIQLLDNMTRAVKLSPAQIRAEMGMSALRAMFDEQMDAGFALRPVNARFSGGSMFASPGLNAMV